jgi:hypothetical protein
MTWSQWEIEYLECAHEGGAHVRVRMTVEVLWSARDVWTSSRPVPVPRQQIATFTDTLRPLGRELRRRKKRSARDACGLGRL